MQYSENHKYSMVRKLGKTVKIHDWIAFNIKVAVEMI